MEKDVGKRDEAAKARKFVPPPPAEVSKGSFPSLFLFPFHMT
jgi:hypothetical protein